MSYLKKWFLENGWAMISAAVVALFLAGVFITDISAKQDALKLQLVELRANVKEANAILAGGLREHTVNDHGSLKGPFQEAMRAVELHTEKIEDITSDQKDLYLEMKGFMEAQQEFRMIQSGVNSRVETKTDRMENDVQLILKILRERPE